MSRGTSLQLSKRREDLKEREHLEEREDLKKRGNRRESALGLGRFGMSARAPLTRSWSRVAPSCARGRLPPSLLSGRRTVHLLRSSISARASTSVSATNGCSRR